jgi:hypothetical protein
MLCSSGRLAAATLSSEARSPGSFLPPMCSGARGKMEERLRNGDGNLLSYLLATTPAV